MAEHKHGDMDITEQKRTFGGFIFAAIYLTVFSIGVLLFMALVNA